MFFEENCHAHMGSENNAHRCSRVVFETLTYSKLIFLAAGPGAFLRSVLRMRRETAKTWNLRHDNVPTNIYLFVKVLLTQQNFLDILTTPETLA